MAGIFFAFSAFVMQALARLPADKGMAAMQSINTTILNSVFFLVFFGSTAACVFAVIHSFRHWHAPGAVYLCAGGVLYLVGSFIVTVVFNVPMNDALAAVSPASHEGAKVWANYLTNWTAWNHVRTITSLAATAAFALALQYRVPSA
ncbi:MAG: DUF1772 domain-containing protein [Abitibacteriaceae bacterium]|nr:DUF1772 domain-containing protein [Abditibacteriaceae bacterium]MBV9864128.1 DUF1772 domain-containing protein [Abditibacteriaceae bacterium]